MLASRSGRAFLTFAGALVGLSLIIALSGVRVARQDIGTVGVVRNGGPLDDRAIRQVLLPGQKLTWIGMFSETPHTYPASNVTRVYEVSSNPSRNVGGGRDGFSMPTKDGVQMELEGAVYLRFIGERDMNALKAFDVGPGTRRFRTPDGKLLYPSGGDEGFAAMLNSLLRPVLDSDLRREVAHFNCLELVASCKIIQTTVNVKPATTASSIALIERQINDTLESDLARTLGQRYFWDVRFRITNVSLPAKVQEAINAAEAKYAEVSSARAELLQARYQNQRNKLLAKTYNSSPALATIEALRAAPPNATVIINAGEKQPTILAGK
jgi:regulator of protease activity HflC (stomatin/prohibitin superfamily)